LQDHRWSGATFRKIDKNEQIGHIGYRVCQARVITATEWVAFTAGVRAGEFD
jgi:hypothetical protein